MEFKNPFKPEPNELGKQFREHGAEPAVKLRHDQIATLKLAAMGLIGGIALGGATLLLLSDDFLWLRELTTRETTLQPEATRPQTMLTVGRTRLPQPGDYWRRCDLARAMGTAPIYRGEPGYREGIDIDNDGIACEPLPIHF